MSVYIHQSGKRSIDYTPGTAVTAGDVVVQNELIGVAVADIAANEKGSLQIDAVVKAPKSTGTSTAIAAGKLVYWDADNEVVTETAGSLKKMGVTVAAATDSESVAYVQMVPGIGCLDNPS